MNALEVYLRVAWACKTPFVFVLDKKYEPRSIAVLMKSVKDFWPDWFYVPEFSDCDDAAFAFKGAYGHGIGIAIGHGHAWNIALCKDQVWHLEPQTGEFDIEKRATVVII